MQPREPAIKITTSYIVRYHHQSLTDFARQVLMQAGLYRERASLVAEILVCSDLMGHTTHGLQLLLPYANQLDIGEMAKHGEPETVSDHGSVVVWDGCHLPGPYLVDQAIQLALSRIQQHGQITVAIGRSHHIACLAAYLEEVTQKNLMIIIMSSDPGNQTVAPFGGLTGVYSPDPIAFGIPTQTDPILFDSSASTVANGVVMQQRAENQRLAGPWLMDSGGNPTDDPEAFFADPPATILPVGGMQLGFKGFGYALLVEALTSGLAGHGRKEKSDRWQASVMVQIIDPEKFGGTEPFLNEMQHLVDRCHQSKPRAGFEQVRMPGERALRKKRQQMQHGVTLHPQVIKTLETCSTKFDVPMINPL